MTKPWSRLLVASTFLYVVFAPAQAQAPAGVLWEMTSQMVMTGLPFSPPPTTHKVCTATQWTRPPPGGDPSCVTSNFQRTDHKVTWDMQCSGQMPMTGHGEITFDGDDSYSGAIDATADGMTIKINLSGKKLDTCDNPVG